MENITSMLSKVLHRQKALYEELNVLLETERECVVNMDVSGLWGSSERKKELVASIQELTESLVRRFKKNSDAETEPKRTLNVSELINGLPCAADVKFELKKTWQAVKVLRDEVFTVSKENRRFINDYLAVIHDIFSVIHNPGGEVNYSPAGTVFSPDSSRSLINAKV